MSELVIACFDLDGVLVDEHKPFSVRLVERQGDEIQPAVNEFFTTAFPLVMIGKAALSTELAPYLDRFHWEGTVKELLEFWFDGEKSPKASNLQLAGEATASGIRTFVVTDNPSERTDQLWPELLEKHLTGKYVSGETGLKKSNPELWQVIASEQGVMLENIFFSDDDPKNVAHALAAGVRAKDYVSEAQLRADLEEFLNS